MNKTLEEFEVVWKKATGEENIVGDQIMKDFLNQALEAQKLEIIEMLEGMQDSPPPFPADNNNPIKHCYQNQGYIRALQDAITNIKKL